MNHLEPQKRITLEDLERLIALSPLLGEKLVTLAPIRYGQDGRLTAHIRQKALDLIEDKADIAVEGPAFFVGSVDWMVRLEEGTGQLSYAVLETNGGSSRGLSLLHPEDTERIAAGYAEMLRFIEDKSPLIAIGCLEVDKLITEKIHVAYRLAEALVRKGLCEGAQVLPFDDFPGKLERGEGLVVIGPYNKVVPRIKVSGRKAYLLDQPISAIIGDGVARRHPLLSKGEGMEVTLANWTFPITDDKYMTYCAVERAMDKLARYKVYPMRFWRAETAAELEGICQEKVKEMEALLIKPFQGSGGAGVLPVLPDAHLPTVIEKSISEFQEKFGKERNPFPYTICEKITPRYALWRDSLRNYDIRIYVVRQGDQLIPLGSLFRIALQPFTGQFTKESMVVNLSGYGGIDVKRGLGLNEQSLKTVRLEEEDMVNIFAASAVLLASIAQNYKEIREASPLTPSEPSYPPR